jgi:hypothetical protein
MKERPPTGADARKMRIQSFTEIQLREITNLLAGAVEHKVLTSVFRDCGYEGPPFRWDEERRFLLRCELDAAFSTFTPQPATTWPAS